MGNCLKSIPDVHIDTSGNITRCRSICCHKHIISVVVSNEEHKKYVLEILEKSKQDIIEKQNSEKK